MKGMIHIFTGDGKGKTTAALGLGMRAYGNGLKVLVVQFLKGLRTGEIDAAKKLGRRFVIYRNEEINKFTCDMNETELAEAKKVQKKIFKYALKQAKKDKWDIIILDEIMAAISEGMVYFEDVKKLIESKPERLELILTGRDAPAGLVKLADYVSEIKSVKHPLEIGIRARKGIES